MTSDLYIALLASSILTIILAIVQIASDSKTTNLNGILTLSFLLYVVIMAFGNAVTTLISAGIIDHFLADTPQQDSGIKQQFLIGPIWIWYSFLGVFGFEAIIQNINITFFDKGVLSISDWLTYAKKSATEATLEKISKIDIENTQRLAQKLIDTKNSSSIHTFASLKLGEEKYNEILTSLQNNSNINLDLYLCYLLSELHPKEVSAEIKAL